MSKSQYPAPVNRTKLYRPPVTEDYIPRDELDVQLNAGIDLPLCIVCAPAGYGKSTLISHWLEVCHTPSAWLSLDESDSDVWVFLNQFVAALRTVSAEACKETLIIINAESLPPLPVIATQLSNDLDELDERLILVLDDYHRIHERGIHIIFDHLLEHPSRNLHLVILSRRDPLLSLASLRAHHMLNEIRMRDLEFSKEETLSLLNRVVGQSLSVNGIEQLHHNMEGWPVGIRLAALALQHQDNVEVFLNQFGAEARQLQEYLVGEVLSGQPRQVREFLLITSILDRFNASLCESMWNNITDKNDVISGKDFINTLEDAGLFCVALDGRRDWFRYHHIFGNLLQRQLKETHSREVIDKLYQSASCWFAENGLYEEAIQYALKGADLEGAAEIVGYARHELMNRDQWHLLERWLKLFSHGAIEKNSQLMVLRCWLDLSHWYRLDALMQDLEKTDALLESTSIDVHEADSLKTEVSVIRGSLAYWTSNPELVETLTEPALSGSSAQQEYVRSIALMLRAGAFQLEGEAVQAERLQRDHIDDEKCKSPGSQARILQGLCFVYWREADTRKLMQAASRLLQISLEHELQWSHSFARYFIGLGHYERNELNDAIEQFEIIVEEPYRYPIQNVTHCSFLLSLCYQSQGLPDRARDVA
ncbi:MAG: hypothetical protein GQ572_09760, partial [Gammaproteobacteria bacterium]|nr:hypothetical protein [Gammaproteobacteria bacterium]